MMTFDEILEAVKHLTPEQQEKLRQALDADDRNALHDSLTPEERARKLEEGFEAMREGLTEKERQELADAMTNPDESLSHVADKRGKTPEERIRLMDEAIAEIRQGMTEKELKEMTDAMNEEYIEPFDESVWSDE